MPCGLLACKLSLRSLPVCVCEATHLRSCLTLANVCARHRSDGWTAGRSPEGYVYYWHAATSTSSWERPTGPPTIEQSVPLTPAAAAALHTDPAAVRKLEDQSGATILIGGIAAVIAGEPRQVARAVQLLERKASGLAYANAALGRVAATHGPPATHAPPATASGAVGGIAASAYSSAYDFRGVAAHVAIAQSSKRELERREQASGGALAALAQYGDDDDDDDDEPQVSHS